MGAGRVTLAERARIAELPVDLFLTREEVAAWLALAPRQVDRLGVPGLRLGHRTVRYRKADITAWLAAHRNGKTSLDSII